MGFTARPAASCAAFGSPLSAAPPGASAAPRRPARFGVRFGAWAAIAPRAAAAAAAGLAAAALLAAAFAGPAPAAAAGAARALVAEDAQTRWRAVGRVNVAGRGFCTGALISPTHVLTAAHCMFNPATKRAADPRRVHFLAGYRMGRYIAHRTGRRVAVDARYDPHGPAGLTLRYDIALIELSEPVPQEFVRPLAIGCCARSGDLVTTLSYGMDRPEALSIQSGCVVLGRDGDILTTSCDATRGVSGAPLLRIGSGGAGELVGVVSAMNGRMRGSAYAVSVDALLSQLERSLR